MEGLPTAVTIQLLDDTLSDSEILVSKFIRDLETGADHPYVDMESAASVIKRIAKRDKCSVIQALETLWIYGCDVDEFKAITAKAREGSKK